MSSKKFVQFTTSPIAPGASISSSPEEALKLGWVPVNGMQLRSLNQRIATGEFDEKVPLLVDEIKQDFGLFTYCLRRIKELSFVSENKKDPLGLLCDLSITQIRQILNVSEGDISPHSLTDMAKHQSLRFKHTLVSSVTSEMLGKRLGVNPQLMFASAVGRQFGLNLIAWNYPRIYAKALEQTLKDGADLEKILLKQLGFNAKSIGLKMMTPESVSESFLIASGEGAIGQNKEGALALKICDIGERFALTTDPEFFPDKTRDYKAVTAEIEHFLGPQGLQILEEEVHQRAITYASVSSKPFDLQINPEINLGLAKGFIGSRLITGNQFVQKTPEWMKELFKGVYSELVPGKAAPEALQKLISEVIPKAGFTKGCVYLSDAQGLHLVPKLRIGEAPLDRYRTISTREPPLTEIFLVDALFTGYPIKQEDILVFGDRVSHVSGAFGSEERPGVLYLEMSDSLINTLENEPIVYFRAVRQALLDCLGLK